MQTPPQITFRGISSTPSIDKEIRAKLAKLETFFDRITSCRVLVEASHRRHNKGNLYHVRIDLRVPGNELVVKRDPAQHAEHEDVFIAIRDAFDEAKRQLQDHVKKRRGM